MSILETFYILFKGDTSDLEKGQKTALKSSSELQDKIKTTNADTLDLGASFLDLAGKAAGVIGATLTLGAAVQSIFSAEKNAQTIGLFSQSTGIAVGNVDALTQATMRYGGSLEGMLGILDTVQQGLTFLNPFAPGGDKSYQPTDLAMKAARIPGLSVHPGMTQRELFDQLHENFKGKDPALNEKKLKFLGLYDPGFQRMLQDTDENYQKISQSILDIGVESDKDADKIFQFNQKLAAFNQQIGVLERAVAGPILDFFNNLPAILDKNKRALDALKMTVEIFGIAFLPVVAEILVAAAPVFLLTVAFIALYDAIYNLSYLEKRFWWIKTIAGWWDDLTTSIGKGIAYFDILADKSMSWSQKLAAIRGIANDNTVGNQPTSEGQAQIDQYNQQEQMLRAARHAINGATASPLSSQGGGVTNNGGAKSFHIGKIEVHTQATDPQGIASAVGTHFEKYINSGIDNFNSSVRV